MTVRRHDSQTCPACILKSLPARARTRLSKCLSWFRSGAFKEERNPSFRNLSYHHPDPRLKARLSRFHRFMDLPAEIRELIYAQYMADNVDDDLTLNLPVEPPLTVVSRVVRRESLSFFYDVAKFPVKMCRGYQWYYFRHPAQIARIRILEFRFDGGPACTSHCQRTLLLSLSFSDGSVSLSFGPTPLSHSKYCKRFQEDSGQYIVTSEGRVKKRLDGIVRVLGSRPLGLSASDLDKIAHAFLYSGNIYD